jgi:chemotaxis signal transduction protein
LTSCRLGWDPIEATHSRIIIIVVRLAPKPGGILADRVLDIVDLQECSLRPVPRIVGLDRSIFSRLELSAPRQWRGS